MHKINVDFFFFSNIKAESNFIFDSAIGRVKIGNIYINVEDS
jgi:hypothetical protein